MPVESASAGRTDAPAALEVRLLGPLEIRRDGAAVALPASRKVRALFAYLSLAATPVARGRLCELLWDVADDPRGELRWCLSKMRGFIDDPGRRRVIAAGDAVGLDLADVRVDALEVARAGEAGFETLAAERLNVLAASFAGDFAQGLEVDRAPEFDGWIAAQRRRFRSHRVALIERLVARLPDDEALVHLEAWLELAPFDRRGHERLLGALARRGQIREGEEHLAAAVRLFQSEDLDAAPLREAWRAARAHADGTQRLPAAAGPGAAAPAGAEGAAAATARRASIAVMPFIDRSRPAVRGGAGDGLVHDIITRLAKLRSLFVIAQGTVFALAERSIGAEEAGRMLNVDYVVSGAVRRQGRRLVVTAELADARTGGVAWAESFDQTSDDTFLVLDEIGDRIVASVASEIETIERNRAILRPPNSLDAWEAHHRGLWHMYRFNKADNERARQFFEQALSLDPTFARAHAGLSFTHFQNAFQGWAERAPEIDRAFAAAGQSLMADDRDPAAHWAMGRALWLRGRHDQSIGELEQAVALSPNFAQGHYALAFVQSQAGDAAEAIAAADVSRRLSPFDPLLFAMLGARAMALVRLERFDEAADWAARAAARPNAHAQVLAIAAFSLALAGRTDEARAHLAAIHKTLPRYGIEDFLAAMRFAPEGEALFRAAARRIGIG